MAIRLVFFDMEGTVFRRAVSLSETNVPPSAWFTIAERLGPEALKEERVTQKRWNNNEYSGYLEWMEDTIQIHAKFGLTKDTFVAVLDSIAFTSGAHEVFNILHIADVRTALVTGGFKQQADRAGKELGIKHIFAGCEYYWDDQERLTHWNLLPADFRGKVDFMHSLSADYGLKREELAFVGDGENDIALAKEVGISIAFNGAKKLQEVTTYKIVQRPGRENLKEILQFLGLNDDIKHENKRIV